MSSFENFPRVTAFLWFNDNAEEAVDFYLSIFKNSRKIDELRTPEGKILTLAFELDGQKFTALNGGPHFQFTEAVSFVVRCDSQTEIDDYWAKLTAGGGSEVQCGWLKDKFGLSWQITPGNINALVRHPKAMEAMLKMKKLDIAKLEQAAKD